jgi:hypothetical protein
VSVWTASSRPSNGRLADSIGGMHIYQDNIEVDEERPNDVDVAAHGPPPRPILHAAFLAPVLTTLHPSCNNATRRYSISRSDQLDPRLGLAKYVLPKVSLQHASMIT